MEILDEELEIYSSPDENYWKLFIGPNANYYIKQWKLFERQDQKVSFHIFALLFNVHWLGYRKMYKYAITVLTFVQIMSFFTSWVVDVAPYQKILLTTLPCMIFGLIGNWLYYNHAKKKIAAIKQKYKNESSREQALKKAGQTNPFFPILLILLSMLLSAINYLLLSV